MRSSALPPQLWQSQNITCAKHKHHLQTCLQHHLRSKHHSAVTNRCRSEFYITGNRMQLPNALGITMQAYVDEIMKNLNDGSFDMQTVPSTVVLNEKNCLYESADNLHYTKLGYAKLGNVIASMILKWNETKEHRVPAGIRCFFAKTNGSFFYRVLLCTFWVSYLHTVKRNGLPFPIFLSLFQSLPHPRWCLLSLLPFLLFLSLFLLSDYIIAQNMKKCYNYFYFLLISFHFAWNCA